MDTRAPGAARVSVRGPDLEAGVLLGFFAGTLATLALAAGSGLAPVQRPATFGLVFWGFYVLFALAFALPLVLLLGTAVRLSAYGLRAAALALLGLIVIEDPHLTSRLSALDGPLRYRLAVPAALLLAVLGVLALALRPRQQRGPARLLAVLAMAAGLVAFFPPFRSRPRTVGDRSAATPIPRQRVLLLGIDGASWDYLDPLLARGELPHFAALKDKGVWGRLKSFAPTRSPAIWTSIATGKPPEEHGILGFMDVRVRGVYDALPLLRGPELLGWSRLHGLLQDRGVVFLSPASSTTRKVPAYWNIASLYGSRVNVVNWWATWPAEAILGSMISELPWNRPRDPLPRDRVTYPEGLRRELEGDVVSRDQVTLEEARRFADLTPEELRAMKAPVSELKGVQWLAHFLSLFETTKRFSLRLLDGTQAGAGADMLVLFSLVDMTSHTSLSHSELVGEHLGASAVELAKFGRVVSEAYRAMDRALGELSQRFGDGNVIVVSDHGFELQDDGGVRSYAHDRAPDGVLLAAGPAFRRANLDGLSVYDILPLLLHLKGFAVANDLHGRVPLEVFDAGFAAANPVTHLTSYGRRNGPDVESAAAVVDQETVSRLRALGYIK